MLSRGRSPMSKPQRLALLSRLMVDLVFWLATEGNVAYYCSSGYLQNARSILACVIDSKDDCGRPVGHLKSRQVSSMSLVDLGKRLLESAKEGETEEVRQLMTNGAPFTTDWLGTSPLHMAAQYGHLATAEVLLRAGMSRDARTKVDRTPLHVAAQEGHIEIVELLLRHGADIEAKDMLKMTPLHWAVEKGNTEVVQCLLNHNADVNALSKFEKSPLDIAIDSQRTDLVQLIQEYAENVQIKPEVATIKSDPSPQVTVSPVIVKTVEAAAPKVIATPVSNASATPKKIVLSTMTTPTSNVTKTTVTPIRAVASKVQNARPILLHANLANLQRAAAATAAAAAAVGAHNKAATISEDSGDSADQSNTSVLATLAALAEATAPNTAASTTDAMQWLETHGISMLPADNSTIVASALEGGQTISLTEAGKLALEWVKDNNSTRVQDNSIASTIQNVAANTANQKVITIVADQSQLPSIISSAQNTPIVVVSGSTVKANTADASPKNAFASSSSEPPSANGKPPGSKSSGENCEQLQKELEEVRRKAEEYRKLLEQKEQEAEVYRKQLEQIKTSQK